eukprot:2697328-Amphidinium_carterae.1
MSAETLRVSFPQLRRVGDTEVAIEWANFLISDQAIQVGTLENFFVSSSKSSDSPSEKFQKTMFWQPAA